VVHLASLPWILCARHYPHKSCFINFDLNHGLKNENIG